MLKRADMLGHSDPSHYLWWPEPPSPARSHEAGEQMGHVVACAMRPAYQACDSMISDTRATRLLDAGERDHVVESITRRMLEHYSHIRLKAKKAALDPIGPGAIG